MGGPDVLGGLGALGPARVARGLRRASVLGTGLGILLALLALAGTHDARGGEVRTTKARPYPEKFQRRVREGIARALESLHGQTQRPLWIHRDADRYRWSADVLRAFRRDGRGLELQAEEEILARLGRRDPTTVEEASLLILALCARPLPDRDPFSRRDPPDAALTVPDRARVKRAVDLLLDSQAKVATVPPGTGGALPGDLGRLEGRGGWSELFALGETFASSADLRGTGQALLALEAAADAGVAVPPERLLAALELLLRWQAPEGKAVRLRVEIVDGDRCHAWSTQARARGWGWKGRNAQKPEGDATANGVLGLAICKAALAGQASFRPLLRARTDRGIRDGLAWIQRHFTVRRCPDPHHAAPPGAELWSHDTWLLRLVQLREQLGLRQLGSHDLYRAGAEAILKQQRENGLWPGGRRRHVAPLLFLLRTGPAPSTALLAPPGGETDD